MQINAGIPKIIGCAHSNFYLVAFSSLNFKVREFRRASANLGAKVGVAVLSQQIAGNCEEHTLWLYLESTSERLLLSKV